MSWEECDEWRELAEEARERSHEKWVRERLIDELASGHDDFWFSLLVEAEQRLILPGEFHEWLKQVSNLLLFFHNPNEDHTGEKLPDLAISILEELKGTTQLLRVGSLARRVHRSTKTVGKACRTLESRGLVSRPNGERSGYAITPAGMLYISD